MRFVFKLQQPGSDPVYANRLDFEGVALEARRDGLVSNSFHDETTEELSCVLEWLHGHVSRRAQDSALISYPDDDETSDLACVWPPGQWPAVTVTERPGGGQGRSCQ